jgi:hypothetical protein
MNLPDNIDKRRPAEQKQQSTAEILQQIKDKN